MKKILLTLAIIFTFSTASFAQFDLDSLFKFGKDVMDQLGKATELTDEEEIQYGDEIATQYNGTIELTTTDQAKVEKIGNKILKYILWIFFMCLLLTNIIKKYMKKKYIK